MAASAGDNAADDKIGNAVWLIMGVTAHQAHVAADALRIARTPDTSRTTDKVITAQPRIASVGAVI